MEAELERVLESPSFRASHRCQEFLRFAVEETLAGRQGELKERVIGTRVFGKPAAYDTGDNSIVRVRANEVRRRLAQYYASQEAHHGVRIRLPSGSYVPEFQFGEQMVAAGANTESSRARARAADWRWIAVASLLLAAAAWALWSRVPARSTAVDRFWEPLYRTGKPVVISVGSPVVYQFSRRVHLEFQKTHPTTRTTGPYVVQLKPGGVPAEDILPVTDKFVEIGEAMSAAMLAAHLAARGRTFHLRLAKEMSFAELRAIPAVLVGGFSNQWTLSLTQNLPFIFERRSGVRGIQETVDAKRRWELPELTVDGRTEADYAIVSRILDSESREPFIAAGGVTGSGTRTAIEALTTPAYLESSLREAGAPPDWESKNMQVIWKLRVISGSPGRPQVVAARFW